MGAVGNLSTAKLSSEAAIRFCRTVLRDLRREYSFFLASAVLFSGVSLLPPQLMLYFAKHVEGLSTKNLNPFLVQVALFGATIAVCMTVAVILKLLVKEWLQLKLEVHLRRSLLVRLHRLPLEKLQGMQRGDWLTKASMDIRATEETLGTTLPDFVYNAALVLGTASLLLFYSGVIALIPVSAALLVALLNLKLQKLLLPLLQEMRTLYAGLFQVLIENLEGWKTIRSHQAFEAEQARVDRKLSSFREKGMTVARVISRTVSAHDFVTSILVTLCLMTLAWGVVNGRLSAQEALFYPFYLGQFFFAVRGMVQAVNGWNRFLPSGDRLAHFFDSEKGLVDEKAYRPVLLPEGAIPSRLVVRDLKMGYAQRMPLLQDFDLEICRGEIRGVVGPSGSGKSTLVEFLSGLRVALGGSLVLENDAHQALWKSQRGNSFAVPTDFCAYVEQKPFLFEGSVRDNLTLGMGQHSDEKLWAALADVGLALTFRAREGLDTRLSDRGINVSGGELYRIAIARALLLGRPFLLLDEPFAALDERAAAHLVKLLDGIKSRAGVFVVTHFTPPSLRFDELYSFFAARVKGETTRPILDFVSDHLRVKGEKNRPAQDGLAEPALPMSVI